MPSQAFQAAADEAKKLAPGPTNSERLRLYALYKIATGTEAAKPGMLEFGPKKSFMYNEWKKLKDEGMQPAEAEEQYIALSKQLKAKHGLEEPKPK